MRRRSMSKMKRIAWVLILCPWIFFPGVCYGDEADLFTTSVNPDALIILDWSWSMGWTPVGQTLYTSTTSQCNPLIEEGATTNVYYTSGNNVGLPIPTANLGPWYPSPTTVGGIQYTQACTDGESANAHYAATQACTGPFYLPAKITNGLPVNWYGGQDVGPAAYPVDCSRIAIAKRGIFTLLDADGNGVLNSNDYNILKVRFGYMHFNGCLSFCGSGCTNLADNGFQETLPSYTQGCIMTMVNIADNNYSALWNTLNSETRLATDTPLVAAMGEALNYLNDTKNGNAANGISPDPAAACRQKFVILITDGGENWACYDSNPGADETQASGYPYRKATVWAVQQLVNAGYKVITIGFGGDLLAYESNTLQWGAYFGETYNPSVRQSGNTAAITVSATPCEASNANDPGVNSISGYSFFAQNPTQTVAALQGAINVIQQSNYNFSITSVSSSGTALSNQVYSASFSPKADPFWPGYIRESTINSDGSLSAGWEAGSILNGNNSRNISTYQAGSVIPFQGSSSTSWTTYLGVSDTNTAQAIISYIRGDATPDNWKLGDIFHSNLLAIGQPNPYFADPRDTNGTYLLYENESSIQSRAKIVVAGANDGQLHAFDGNTGSEHWSFIPANLVPKLQFLAHTNNPSYLLHQFFVDGPISAADVWVGSGSGTAKSVSDWHTYLVFGEGKGVRDNTGAAGNTSYLWSSSPYCDQNFNVPPNNSPYVWTSTYQYYCGYHALDVTATGSTPLYNWKINSTASTGAISSSHGPYLGEPWSKMAIGKVIISGNETWVGMIGGGYGQSGTAGQGFFVVSLHDGHILWSYTNQNNSAMSYIPAAPTIVDTDNDGFIDTVYVGDLSGQMWRFTFCTGAQGNTCGTGSWSGGLFFQPSTAVPIYTAAAVSWDSNSNLWVFWGTGDKTTPNNTSSSSAGTFYAVKDNSRSGTYGNSNLQNITGTTYYTANATTQGWYILLSSGGEKMLSDPTVFGGMVLFTTYLPYTGTNPCVEAGSSYLYAMAMQNQTIPGAGTFNTGAGLLTSGARSVSLGSGIASAPTIAQSSPGAASSLFVSVGGGLGTQGTTPTTLPTVTETKGNFDQNSGLIKRLAQTGVSTQIIQWRDGRIQ